MAVSIQHLRPADYRVMPWRNGQGTTTEIAAEPPGAGLDTFTWRISMAEVLVSGPFSRFPGVERVLIQTAGEVMTLTHEARAHHRLAPFQPHRFAGEWETAAVVSGPVRDFNVMTRRGRTRASVAVHELGRGSRLRAGAAAGAVVVYAFRGSLSVRANAGGQWQLGAGETWLLRGERGGEPENAIEGEGSIDAGPGDDTGFELMAEADDAVAFVIAFA